MVFPILGGNGAVAGYSIDNSLRFNDDDSAYLSRTPSSAGNRKTYTVSFWVKRSNIGLTYAYIFDCDNGASQSENPISFDSDKIRFSAYNGSSNDFTLETTQVFRDTGAWYHITQVVDTTQATASNRVKFYINGSQITDFGTATYPSLNYDMAINSSSPHSIGRWQDSGGRSFDGYLAEFHFIDGTAKSPTDFGEYDEDSGIWKPISYSGSYGTNGFYLDFKNSGSLGADQSGNGNNFTPTNLSATDQVLDTPTNNWCTLNSLFNTSSLILKEGNLHTESSSGAGGSTSTYNISKGKWYFETCYISGVASYPEIGIINGDASFSDIGHTTNTASVLYRTDGKIYKNTGSGFSVDQTVTASSTGDIIGIAINLDDQQISFYVNNTQVGSTVDISYMSNDIIVRLGFGYHVAKLVANFGQDSSFAGNETRQNNSDGNGYGDFYYSPPSGYLALCTQNLATALSPTIDDGSEYFSATKYQGGGFSAQSITGVGFQPDWVWVKNRTVSASHVLYDSNRGVQKALFSDSTSAETTRSGLTSFDSDGFSLGSAGTENGSSSNEYISWNWLANGGTTSSNTDGSITSTVQANTTAGFSIITYTGTGANATVGHGLGVAPAMTIHKRRDSTSGWLVYHQGYGATKYLQLNSTDATTTASFAWNDTEPTSSVISMGTAGGNNSSGGSYVAYCFAEIEGYSKFGSYTGNGSSDGVFIYTGFKPAWVMVKRSNDTGYWVMFDNTRQTENENNSWLLANDSSNEGTNSTGMDFVSNGFKLRNSSTGGVHNNISGSTYIYMAFAENPFVTSSGVPVTAR